MPSGGKFDPSKIKSPYGALAAFLLVVQAVLIYWFAAAETSFERIAAGIVLTVNAFLFLAALIKVSRIPSAEAAADLKLARQLCGNWIYSSEASSGDTAAGDCTITLAGNQLVLSGTYKVNGVLVGTWSTEMTRLRENRILFYYVLRDKSPGHGLSDAVSVLLFDPQNLAEMVGDWILVGKESRQGSVRFTRKDSSQQ